MWEQFLKDINFKQKNDTWIACKYKQFHLQRNFGSNETKETKKDKALIKSDCGYWNRLAFSGKNRKKEF